MKLSAVRNTADSEASAGLQSVASTSRRKKSSFGAAVESTSGNSERSHTDGAGRFPGAQQVQLS
jgi:hypothetical protein